MPSISAGSLAKLRGLNHKAEFFLSVCPALVLWSARVNDVAILQGEYEIDFDSGSGLDFAAVGELQSVWVGSIAGAYDKGKLRIKSVTSGDSGVTGTVTVAEHSVLLADNDYLTFVLYYDPLPRRPRLGGDGTFYKDGGENTGGITYSDQNTNTHPVCIAGENRAGFLSGGSFVVASQLPSSYVTKSGATITSYSAALVYPTSGATVNVNGSTGVGDITFTAAGFYWVKWSVTDSNGKVQNSYRWYAVHDSDPTSANYPHIDFSVSNLSGDWNSGGWQCGIQLNDNADLDKIPDGAPAIVWARPYYQGAESTITFLNDGSTTLINGYVRQDRFDLALDDGADTADFTITTVHGVMASEFNYSVSMEAKSAASAWYQFHAGLTPGLAVHHFLKWHSTILEVTDVMGLTDDSHGIAFAEFENGTIMSMPDSFLRDRSIRHRLVCDKGGRVRMLPDVQLLPDADRAALTVTADLENTNNADKSDVVTILRQQEQATPFVHVSGFSFDGTFNADGKPNASPICAIAPGDTPSDRGASPISLGRQTFTDQTEANAIAGRVYANANNLYPECRIQFHGNYLGVLEVALAEFWTMSMLATENLRGIVWTDKNLILRNVAAQINTAAGTIQCTATFQPEADPFSGVTTDCPSFPAINGENFTPPVDEEAGGALLTGGSIYRLPPQIKTWDLEDTDDTNDVILDPFWPTRVGSIASNLAIVWRCGNGYIERSIDGGITWSDVTPSAAPPNDSSDGSPPTAANLDYIMLDSSLVNQGEFVALGRWQNGSSQWRAWLAYTDDDGVTWSWSSVAPGSGSTSSFTFVDNATTSLDDGQVRHVDAFLVDNELGITANDSGYMRQIYIDASYNITYGSRVAHGGSVNADEDVWCLPLTATRGILIFGGPLKARLFDIDPLAAVGTMTSISPALNTSLGMTAAVVNPTLVVVVTPSGSPNLDLDVVFCAISGDIITWGTPYQLDTDASNVMRDPNVIVLDATNFLVTWRETSVGVKAAVIRDVSGTPTLIGSVTTIASEGVFTSLSLVPSYPFPATNQYDSPSKHYLTHATGSNYAMAFRDGSTQYVIVFNATVAGVGSVGSATTVTYSISGLLKISDGNLIGFSGSDPQTISISGLTVTPGTATDITSTANAVRHLLIESGAVLSVAMGLLETSGNSDAYSMTYGGGGGGGHFKATSIALDKYDAGYIVVTGWDSLDDTLRASVIDTRSLAELDYIHLGSTTLAQLDAGTYVVWAKGALSLSAGAFYLHGRLNSPPSIGSLTHLMLIEDAGLIVTKLIGTFSTDIVAAVADKFLGDIYTVQVGSVVKLNGGASGDKVLSTTPLQDGVEPHGLFFDDFNGVIYLANNAGDSVMVVRSQHPYLAWTDITYDHGTADGIKAIVKL